MRFECIQYIYINSTCTMRIFVAFSHNFFLYNTYIYYVSYYLLH